MRKRLLSYMSQFEKFFQNGLENCEVYGLPFIFVTLMNKLHLNS